MSDNYFLKLFKREWKTILSGVLLIIIVGISLKNIGEIPYENQHLMTARLTLQFPHQGKTIQGLFYASYWVETPPEINSQLGTTELNNYLLEHGQISLEPYQEEIIELLQTYSLEEIMDNWYSDYEFFKNRDIYFIKNDRRLMNFLQQREIKLDLPYQYKKVFFVYLDENTFNEYTKGE